MTLSTGLWLPMPAPSRVLKGMLPVWTAFTACSAACALYGNGGGREQVYIISLERAIYIE